MSVTKNLEKLKNRTAQVKSIHGQYNEDELETIIYALVECFLTQDRHAVMQDGYIQLIERLKHSQ